MLADNKMSDFAELFRLLYDEVDDYGKGHIAECILTISRYQLFLGRAFGSMILLWILSTIIFKFEHC